LLLGVLIMVTGSGSQCHIFWGWQVSGLSIISYSENAMMVWELDVFLHMRWKTKPINLITVNFIYHSENINWNVTGFKEEGISCLLVDMFLCLVNLYLVKACINSALASRGKLGFKNLGYNSCLGLKSELVKIKNTGICIVTQLWYLTALSCWCSWFSVTFLSTSRNHNSCFLCDWCMQ
jgi:hypothetical protein